MKRMNLSQNYDNLEEVSHKYPWVKSFYLFFYFTAAVGQVNCNRKINLSLYYVSVYHFHQGPFISLGTNLI